MLRASTGTLTRLVSQDGAKIGSSSFSLEFVRWRRKPRWLPVAKSKMFRVPERKRQDEEERAELLRLHNNYKTQLRSVRQYFRAEAQRIEETSTADHIVLTAEQEEAEYQRCLQENEAWNKVIAAERNARLEKERQQRAAYIAERLELARVREEEEMERIEAIVRREKEAAKTFITRDKLDAAIEHALANPVDYNFSIDIQGNMYHGRTTLPGGGSGSQGGTQSEKALEKEKAEATN